MKVIIPEFCYDKDIILRDIDLNVAESQIIGLVAPNGTGKTTLIRLISGHLKAPNVKVELDGNTYDTDTIEMRRQIVKMPEQADLYDELSSRDHLNYYADLWQVDRTYTQEVIDMLKMSSYSDQAVGTYSLGMRQRLCFALMVVTKAKVLLLDEVMNGLDPDNVTLISNVLFQLKDQGTTLIIASHLLNNLDNIADTILFLNEQTIALTYTPTDSNYEVLAINFLDRESQKQFQKTFDTLPVEKVDQRVTIDTHEVSQKDLSELIKWIGQHVSSVSDVKLTAKGSEELFRELYQDI